ALPIFSPITIGGQVTLYADYGPLIFSSPCGTAQPDWRRNTLRQSPDREHPDASCPPSQRLACHIGSPGTARHTGNSSQVVGQGVPGWCLYLPGRPFPRTGTAAIAESQRSDSGPGSLSRSQSSTGPVIFCA